MNPLVHPDLIPFLEWCKEQNYIANITVNQRHLKPYITTLKHLIASDLIKGVGISIVNDNYTEIRELQELTNNIVFHVIAGVNTLEQVKELTTLKYSKILVLGYKQFGRGVDYYSSDVEESLKEWKDNLKLYIGKGTLSFDNLAIEQLDIRSWFTEKGWNKFYMGDDFTFTMYIDAVEEMYAPTSRDVNKKSFDEISLLDYFKNK